MILEVENQLSNVTNSVEYIYMYICSIIYRENKIIEHLN